MPSDPSTVYNLIVEIRRAFNDLKTYSDRANADLDISAAMRAVMEHLDAHGPQPVPDIARAKNVTRQHIQQLADALVADGLARYEDNPAHKRSKLLVLSDAGRRAFSTIQKREKGALAAMAAGLSEGELDAAAATIASLRNRIAALSSS
ncbi:MAG: MarR family transcriptional regulator [Hyphomicrobiales bacterium]|nr:MarR family transcriptional regulator [Hyphomicrobiales bacterium]MCP5001331.1 MarR family transcriptional regulator [Hyphomicrobiales bacterium]